jgi:hypothetical protein
VLRSSPAARRRRASVSPPWLALILVAAGGCGLFQEGRQHSETFLSPFDLPVLRDRSLEWFAGRAGTGYEVVESTLGLVRGEVNRGGSASGGRVDVVTVYMDALREGTQVRVQAISYELRDGRRERADQVSMEAVRDARLLIEFLMDSTG